MIRPDPRARLPPAVVVHGLSHARAALRPGLPVCLLSGLGAARYGGVGWWRAMIEAALAEADGPASDVLDCDDAPGLAMAALRHGQRLLILHPGCPARAAVEAAAATVGAEILDRRPEALDLAAPGAERGLLEWLSRH